MKRSITILFCLIMLTACMNPSGQTAKERELADKEEYLKLKEKEMLDKEKRELEEQKKELEAEKAKLNESKSTPKETRPVPTNSPVITPPTASPDAFVGGFLRDLGGQQFSKAYAKCAMPHLKSYKSLSYFSSINAYGGITRVDTKTLRVENESAEKAKVYALYYAEDPYNKNGNYEQYFHLTNKGGEWKITKIETINMRQY